MIPTNWAEAFAAAAENPRSRAPLLAIALAIRERYAALGLPDERTGTSHPSAGFHGPMPGDVLVFPETRIYAWIRDLQSRYYNPHVPYGDRGYNDFPDALACEYGRASAGGVSPFDALALMPPPGGPLPGDSTASAATRAFYEWAMNSINQMTMVVPSWGGLPVRSTVRYEVDRNADGGDPQNIASFLGAARRSEGVYTSSTDVGFNLIGFYDSIGDFYWDKGGGFGDVSIMNPFGLPATARMVLKSSWPLNEWSMDDYSAVYTCFDTFGAPGCVGFGPSSVISDTIEPGEWMRVWPDPGAFPVPSARTPAWPGRIPGVGRCYFDIQQDVSFLFDFSDSFRFRGGGDETT